MLLQLLGLNVRRQEIEEMLDEVDRDGSGEVEYPEFLEIMTTTLAKLQERKEQQSNQAATPVSGSTARSKHGRHLQLLPQTYSACNSCAGIMHKQGTGQPQGSLALAEVQK